MYIQSMRPHIDEAALYAISFSRKEIRIILLPEPELEPQGLVREP